MGTLYSMRSDQAFNAQMFENIIMGEATAQRLELVMDQRELGVVPAANIVDSRYQDLMEDHLACIENIYRHFGMPLGDQARQRMLAYLAEKPQGKFGVHRYEIDDKREADRLFFQRYQSAYDIPNEC